MKNWFVVRLNDETREAEAIFGLLKKKKAKRLAGYYNAGLDVETHYAIKMEEPDALALKNAKKRERDRAQGEATLARM